MALVGAGMRSRMIGTILILFGYFQLNHATRGFYAGRLQSLALVLIVDATGIRNLGCPEVWSLDTLR